NGAEGLQPDPEKAKQLFAPFDDENLDYTKLILGHSADRGFIHMYSLYQRALEGEIITEDARTTPRLSPSIEDPNGERPYEFVSPSTLLMLLMGRDIFKLDIEPDSFFERFIPLGQFECYYPLIKEFFDRLPQDLKERIKIRI